MKKNKYINILFVSLLAIVSGILLTLAFAPFHIWILSFVSLIILFYLWSISHSMKNAFFIGLLFGLGNFGSGISWVFVSIHTYGNASIFIASLITALFILALSMFPAIVGMFNQKLCSKKNNYYQICFIYPATWTLFEWIRSWLFTGFPWLLVGYSQTDTYLSGLAEIGSVYLVSFALCLCVSAFLMIFRARRVHAKIVGVLIIIIIWSLGYFFLQDQKWTVKNSKPISVSLVQGNIKPMIKWDANHLRYILKTYYSLTKDHPADLIFWPENAIPIFPSNIEPFLNNVNDFAIEHNSAILIGMPLGDRQSQYYNGAIVKGYGFGQYKKQHLVPFGEYLPLRSMLLPIITWMDAPMSQFTKGGYNQGTLDMKGFNISLFICYEIAFPSLVRYDSENADIIVTITDDGWFGKTIAPWQHLQMTHMRAIENGKYVIQATNDGISAIITPDEVITYPPFKQGVLQGEVYAMKGQTPWVRYGILPVLMLVFLSLILGIVVRRRQPKD